VSFQPSLGFFSWKLFRTTLGVTVDLITKNGLKERIKDLYLARQIYLKQEEKINCFIWKDIILSMQRVAEYVQVLDFQRFKTKLQNG